MILLLIFQSLTEIPLYAPSGIPSLLRLAVVS